MILVIYTYYATVAIGVMLLVYVMRQAMDNIHLNRSNTPAVRMARNVTFGIAAYFLCFTAYFQSYWLTSIAAGIVAIGLVSEGILILAVNVISLNQQRPPTGHKHHHSFSASHVLARLTSYFSPHG